MSNETFVIVGASLAGARAAEALRDEGFDGRVVLLGDESEHPYERPPLSKDYLMGKSGKEKIYVHAPNWYQESRVELRLGTLVTGVDRSGHEVETSGGERIAYDRLLLTTGASPRRLPLPGGELPDVWYLRRVEDSERLRAGFRTGARLVVIGAGWIGLEAAAAARDAGVDVVVLEALELPLVRVLGPECARIFAELHRRHGVDLRFGVRVESIEGATDGGFRVRLGGGETLAGDMVLVGIGARPNIELAEAAGLTVSNGVEVDAGLRTSDPAIYAAGDVANAYHPLLGRHIRVEHWDNAVEQPKAAARSMLGRQTTYDRIPYFYTDQYELSMEYAGHMGPGEYRDVVFRGDVDRLEFIAFWLDEAGRVLAGMNVNVWDVNPTIQSMVRSGRPIDRHRLADTGTDLQALVSEAARG